MSASVAQLVEQRIENPRVVGSIPTGGTIFADLAHLVERDLAKVEVAGSRPVIRSKKRTKLMLRSFFYPSRRLGISSPCEVRCISSAPMGVYLITRQRASPCGLMIYRNKLRMIYNASH